MTGGTTKVLYIAGVSRSGTTLLGMLLGQIDGWFDGGELRRLWRRGLADHHRCGCGEPVSSCPQWKEIGSLAYGGFDQVDMRTMLAADDQLFSSRYLPLDLARGLNQKRVVRERTYCQTLARLYSAIAEATAANVVVDSSKHPTYGALVGSLPTVDLFALHVVRDPRGVTYSRRQRKVNPASGEAMGGVHPLASVYSWNIGNAAIERMLYDRDRCMRLRYEDFVAHPTEILSRIAEFVGADTSLRGVELEGRTAKLRPTHSVSGNPVRFDAGTVEIRSDDRWRGGLAAPVEKMVQLLTLPIDRRYGQAWQR